MKIVVLDYRIPDEVQRQIQSIATNKIVFPAERCPEELRIERTGNAEIVLVTPWDKIDKVYLDACTNLKYVGLCGTSTANVDLGELDRRGIAFTNMHSGNEDRNAKDAGGKEGVAEFFFMQLVRLARGIGKYQWKLEEVHQLKGRSLGIIGLGDVGKGIAHMALAYKMNVAYYSPHRKPEWEEKGVVYKKKEDLLKTSEVIVICSTTNVEVITKDDFTLIKDGTILVQACGGSPFDKPAFYNWISGAGNFAIFDMSTNETNYRLYKDLDGVIFSRMVAGDTHESNIARARRALHNLNGYISSVEKS